MKRMSLFRSLKPRSRGALLIGLATFVLAATLAGGATALIGSSTFEGSDGNFLVDTTGHSDWCNVGALPASNVCPTASQAPNLVAVTDQTNSSKDNSFGQGTKEDSAAVSVVAGSIPNNKSDLARFYTASEVASDNHNYLYLGWERASTSGSVDMDFEINQNPTSGFDVTTTGNLTLNRTAGDLLLTFDFSGSGAPTLGLLKWVTTGSRAQCYSASALPCWGNRVDLNASAGLAEGAVNAASVIDPLDPGAPRTLAAQTFGEASVDLTAAGVFPAGTCEAFGSVFNKSRSSSSFSAEIKDFIAPRPINVSNCGTVNIHKVAQNGDDTFGYTTSGLTPASFNLSNGGTKTFTLIQPGTGYSVTESPGPGSWILADLTCGSVSGPGTVATPSGSTVNITIGVGGVVDCTYTNHISVTPTVTTTLSATNVAVGGTVHDSATISNGSGTPSGSVTFTVYKGSDCSTPAVATVDISAQPGSVTVNANGTVPDSPDVSFLKAGTYQWQASYSGDGNNNTAKSVCGTEQLTVPQNIAGITTAQDIIPNDSASLSGLTSSAGGTLTFSLYSPTDATCSNTPAYTKTVDVSGNGTYSTGNQTTFHATVVGTWKWKTHYSGDVNNTAADSACGVEAFTIKNT